MTYQTFKAYRDTEGLDMAKLYAEACGVKSAQVALWAATK